MFRHVVLLRYVDHATPEQRTAVIDGLSALPAQIPGLRNYVIGDDAGVSTGNFDFAAVADFDDEAGYRAWATNPEHLRVIAERIRPILADRAAVQYVVPD